MLLLLTGRPGCLSQGRMVLGLPHRPLPHCQKYPIAGSHVCCQPSGSRPQIDGIWGASSYARDALGSGQTPARSEQQSAVPWPPVPVVGPLPLPWPRAAFGSQSGTASGPTPPVAWPAGGPQDQPGPSGAWGFTSAPMGTEGVGVMSWEVMTPECPRGSLEVGCADLGTGLAATPTWT